MIKVSEVTISPVEASKNGLLGFASLVIADSILLSSIGIFTDKDKQIRLTYPIRKNTRQNLNFFFPINKEVAEAIEQIVIKKLKETIINKK